VTDSSSETPAATGPESSAAPESAAETLPSLDGLPRRKPAAKAAPRAAKAPKAKAEPPAGADPITDREEELADALEAEVEAEQARLAAEAEDDMPLTLRERGLLLTPLEIARKIVDAAEDKKAADIVLLEVSELTSMADFFVICSGGSERQLGAIADGITEKLHEEGVRPIGREGGSNSHWTLVDFGCVIVHIFAVPERDYYQLERHWAKAKTILRVQ